MNLSHKKALFSAINKLWWHNLCYLWVWRGFWKSGFFLFISFFIILVCLNAYGLEVWFNLFMLWLGVPSCLYLVIASLSNVSRLFDWCSHIALLRLDSYCFVKTWFWSVSGNFFSSSVCRWIYAELLTYIYFWSCCKIFLFCHFSLLSNVCICVFFFFCRNKLPRRMFSSCLLRRCETIRIWNLGGLFYRKHEWNILEVRIL